MKTDAEQLREELADEQAWLCMLKDCCGILDEVYRRIERDKNDAEEYVANAAVRLATRLRIRQDEKCCQIKRRLEEIGGGE